jgi:hypothetical protein
LSNTLKIVASEESRVFGEANLRSKARMASFTFDADQQLIVSDGKDVKIVLVGEARDP